MMRSRTALLPALAAMIAWSTALGHILARLAVAAIVLGRDVSAIGAQIPDEPRRAAGSKVMDLVGGHEECNARLGNFVSELDALLDVNPNSLEPLLSLLQRSFPLKNCDIQTAITICRRSKYFAGLEERPDRYVFGFTNAFSGPFSGFDVLFSLLKPSGDSEHQFARIRMGR
jgi:hypothetical protein